MPYSSQPQALTCAFTVPAPDRSLHAEAAVGFFDALAQYRYPPLDHTNGKGQTSRLPRDGASGDARADNRDIERFCHGASQTS